MLASNPGRRARTRLSEKPRTGSAAGSPAASPLPRAARKKTPLALVRVPELPAERGAMPPRIARFLETADLPSPCLVVDVDLVEPNYRQLPGSPPGGRIFYALKGKPPVQIPAPPSCLGRH